MFNNEDGKALDASMSTGLPPGTYCDIISGNVDSSGRACTGKSLVVDDDGKAHVHIAANEAEGVLAVHVEVNIFTQTQSSLTNCGWSV